MFLVCVYLSNYFFMSGEVFALCICAFCSNLSFDNVIDFYKICAEYRHKPLNLVDLYQ